MVSPARLVRASNWWSSKLPPLIGVALAAAVVFDRPFGRTAAVITGVILVTGGAVGAWGHVLNDAFDLAADRRVGRRNLLAGVPKAVQVAIAALCVALAYAPAPVLGYSSVVLGLLTLELALPALYSVPPVRLKERGWAGAVTDAAGAHVLPAAIVLAAMAGPGELGRYPLFVALVLLWSASSGIEGILWHQLKDRTADRAAGVRTWAAGVDAGEVRRAVLRLHPVKVVLASMLVGWLAPASPILLAAFGAYLVLEVVKSTLGWEFVYADADPLLRRPYGLLVSNVFAELWLPVALVLEAGRSDARFLWIGVALLVVFHRNTMAQVSDLLELTDDLVHRLADRFGPSRPPAAEHLGPAGVRRGWRLEVHPPAAARLEPGAEPNLQRVCVEDPGEVSWQVKLDHGPFPVTAGNRYQLSCDIRSEARRTITACLVRASEPWDNLGLSEEVELGPDWRSLWFTVEATDSADARFSLLLGLGEASVEVAVEPMVRWITEASPEGR